MRWRRFILWAALGAIALIVLVMGWLLTADLGVFKPQLERLVTEEIGQEFSIDGELHIDLSRHMTLVAEDLRFANAPWAESDDMISVARVEVTIDLLSLFRGLLLIENLDIDDTRVLLLNPGDTEPNWERLRYWLFEVETDIEVLFGVIDIDRLQVRLESVERDRPLNLDIETFDQAYRDDGFLELGLDATLDGRVVRLDGELGTWEALLAGKDLRFDVEAVLDTFEFSARGRIDDVAAPLKPEIEFTAAGPDIDDLSRMLGVGEEGEGDINLSGSLARSPGDNLVLSVRGNLGMTEVDAAGEVSDLQSFGNVRLKAVASGPDLGRILRLAGIHQVREAPFMLNIDAETLDGTLLVREASMVFAQAQFEGSARLPKFPGIDDAVIRIRIEGPDIERFRYITGIPGAASGPFSLAWTMDVRDDGIEIFDFEAETDLGKIEADGSIGNPEDLNGSQLRFRLTSGNLARTAGAYGLGGLPAVPVEITGGAEYTREGIRSVTPVVVTIPENSASFDGFVPFTTAAVGADIHVGVKGADFAHFVNLFTEVEDLPSLPYDVTARLRIEQQGYRFDDFDGTLGSSSLSGNGLLVLDDSLSGTRFNLKAGGPALEELTAAFGGLGLQPGPYELSAGIAVTTDSMRLRELILDRKNGHLELDLSVGLPTSRKWLDFALSTKGGDVRSLVGNLQSFEPYEQPFLVDARGKMRGDRVDFERVSGAVGEATFEAAGQLAFGEDSSTEFNLELTVPNLAAVGTVNGRRFNEQAFSLRAVAAGRQGTISVDDLDIRIGDSDLRGKVRWRGGDVPEITVDIRSERLVYLPPLVEREDYDREPEFDDGRLIPDIAIPFEAMKKIDASVTADIRELQRGNLHLRNVEFDASLRDGALDVRTLRFDGLSGALQARASLEPAGGAGAASLEVVARDIAFGLREANQDLAMKTDMDVKLRATGADTRAMAGRANGIIFLNVHGGRITANRVVRALYGDMLEEMLDTINPFRQSDPYTEFECLIVPVSITDGQVSGAPNVFASTGKIRIVLQGSVNLKTEKIKLGVRSTPRRIVSLSAAELVNPYLQIVGTMAAPQLAVDEAGVLITGGAAVATGGLTLLARGIWDRLSKSGDACKQMSGQAQKALEGQLPDLSIEGTTRTE